MPEKNENWLQKFLFRQFKVLGSSVKGGDIVNVLVAIAVILAIFFLIAGNVKTSFGYLVDLMLLVLFLLLAYASAVSFNNNVKGLDRFLPACHDIKDKIAYCARHRGLYIGFLFWPIVFTVLNAQAVSLTCSFNDSLVFGPFLLILLIVLPFHGLFTKMGGKSSPEFRSASAFFWVLVIVSSAYYYHYTFIRPC